ncbi:MAG: glycerol kinase GlpK [Eubacteriales bacterium]|nr:glycerol kinase GlpK [Eubacteriales bacterium]
MSGYLMALDQGTTSSRCIIFDDDEKIVAVAQQEFPNYFPAPGWVEHDPREIWNSQLTVMRQAISKAGLSASDIAAIGITNQRETTMIWDRRTGEPVYNAIVWQCRRTADYCDELKAQGLTDKIRSKTGLIIDSYFSATKIKWILDNIPGVRQRAERGELMFGTVDTWLIYNLTGGRVHATDPSNASRTMLFNIRNMCWDSELLELFGIPKPMMPQVLPSSGLFGYTAPELLGGSVAIAGVAGDQQAALFGQCCFEAGEVKNTYGTGGFMLMNTGTKPVFSQNGLLTSIVWSMGGKTCYALEGSVFICGAAVQWLRDGLGLIAGAAESEQIAASIPDSDGVYFVPAFVGLGAPYWDAYARGALFGLTRATGRAHVVRAVLESMAYQTVDVLELMQKEAGVSLTSLRVDGGACANNLLLDFQADISGLPIIRPACIETTALGAANLAGLAVGVFGSADQIAQKWRVERRFDPHMNSSERVQRMAGWHKAVSRTRGWTQDI